MWKKNNQSNFARMRIDCIANYLKLIHGEYRSKSKLILILAFRLIDEWHFFAYKQKLMFLTRRNVFLLSIDFFFVFHQRNDIFLRISALLSPNIQGKQRNQGSQNKRRAAILPPLHEPVVFYFCFFFEKPLQPFHPRYPRVYFTENAIQTIRRRRP